MPFRRILAALLAWLALPVLATPQLRDATDMWFNAAESGWGVNIIHQGDTLFATLFVNGQDGQPRWFVASSLAGGPTVYSGPLFEQAGPSFAASTFDPGAVTRRQVGTMSLTLGDGGGTLDYTVDGVHVTKPVIRFTFRPTDLSGLHRAFVIQATTAGPDVRRDLERFAIIDNGTSVAVDSSSDSEPACSWMGAHAQDGQDEVVVGTFACGDRGSAGQGNWAMRVDPTPSGFVGTFSSGSPIPGRIAAALADAPKLEGTGWRNGMWFTPSESGWGVNVIEQGDTIFATLFVYDAQGRPHWYVASDLARSGSTPDGTAVNSGPLFEVTGPYFGAASFDPAAVTRRQVGTMGFQVRSPGIATLTYSVDGVSVTKTVQQFAFRRNDASGTYMGQLTETPGGHDPATITIDDRGGPFAMRIAGMFGGSTCDYTGTSRQFGHVVKASGTLQCGGTSAATANFVLKNLIVDAAGITGRVELSNVTGFVQEGFKAFHFAGARLPS